MIASRIRVAIVLSNPGAGGRERSAVRLAANLDSRRFDPILICLSPPGPLLERETQNAQVKLVCFNKGPGVDPVTLFRFAQFLKRQKFLIVHSNNWGTLLECVLAAKWAGIRGVLHTQGGLDYGSGERISQRKVRLRKRIKQVCAKLLCCVIAVSGEIRDVVRQDWKVPDHKIRIVRNGVVVDGTKTVQMVPEGQRLEWRANLGFEPQDVVIGSVGYFRTVKGFSILISAMAHVVKDYPTARLVLLGEGPLQGDLERQVVELAIEQNVRFVGQRPDVVQLLPMMDIFALNSISEGISNAILEAMAAGLPIVATDVGGNPEVVSPSETGILVPASSPMATAHALSELIGDSSAREKMGQRGRERIESCFSLEKIVQEYEALYTEFASDKPVKRVEPARL